MSSGKMKYRTEYEYSPESLESNPAEDLSGFRVAPRDHVYTLGLSLTRKCNLNCRFCYYHETGDSETASCGECSPSTETDPPDTLARMLEVLPILACINVSLEGEPLCHSRFSECMEIITRHTDSIILTTNGQLLTPEILQHLKSLKICRIVLSCEAGDPESYEHFRKGASFRKFRTAAELLNESGIPWLVYGFLFRENMASFLKYPKLAGELGIGKTVIGRLRECPYSRKNSLHRIPDRELLPYLEELHKEFVRNGIALEYDPYISAPENTELLRAKGLQFTDVPANEGLFCNFPWYCTNILSDGKIFPCCGDFQPREVREYSFDGIFNSRYLLILRRLLSENRVPEVCLKCRNLI